MYQYLTQFNILNPDALLPLDVRTSLSPIFFPPSLVAPSQSPLKFPLLPCPLNITATQSSVLGPLSSILVLNTMYLLTTAAF